MAVLVSFQDPNFGCKVESSFTDSVACSGLSLSAYVDPIRSIAEFLGHLLSYYTSSRPLIRVFHWLVTSFFCLMAELARKI